MGKFKDFYNNPSLDQDEFREWLYYTSIINEGFISNIKDFISSIPDKFHAAVEFIKMIADQIKTNVSDIIELLKNPSVYSFFKAIGWSIRKIVDALGYVTKKWTDLRQLIVNKLFELKPLETIRKNWNSFCEWCDKHIFKPLGMVGSLVLGGLLVIIWLNMTFTGDFEYDFNNSLIIDGLKGSLTFSACFYNNVDLLILLVLGLTGNALSPWGPAGIAMDMGRLALSLIYGIIKQNKDSKMIQFFSKVFIKDLPRVKTFNTNKISNNTADKLISQLAT